MKRSGLLTIGLIVAGSMLAGGLFVWWHGSERVSSVTSQPHTQVNVPKPVPNPIPVVAEPVQVGKEKGSVPEIPEAPDRKHEHPAPLTPSNSSGIYYQNKVIVLMYHDVTPGQSSDKTLTVDKFDKQLAMMQEAGFKWISMDTYVDFILHGKRVPNNAVLLTFDDGYETLYQYAYPILKKYKAPATGFLVVNTVDNQSHIGLPKVTWDQVREMHRNGLDFYNHTFDSHVYGPLDRQSIKSRAVLKGPIYQSALGRMETKQEYLARVRSDLELANQILEEKLGNTKKILAFPYGAYSPSVLRLCKELNMPVTFTVQQGINEPGTLNGYRLNAGGQANNPGALLELMKQGETLTPRPAAPAPAPSKSIAIAQQKDLKSKLH